MSCKRRHRYRGALHAFGCDVEASAHWHVVCKRCDFTWLQLALFRL